MAAADRSSGLLRRFHTLRRTLEAAILDGPATVPAATRRAAAALGDLPEDLVPLVTAVHRHAHRITDEQIARLREDHSDDTLFEIAAASAVGAARLRLETALALFGEEDAG